MPNSGAGQPTVTARSRGSALPALLELWFSSSSWRSGQLSPSDASDPTIGHRREARRPHGTTGTAVSERRCLEQSSNGDTSFDLALAAMAGFGFGDRGRCRGPPLAPRPFD